MNVHQNTHLLKDVTTELDATAFKVVLYPFKCKL